MAVQRDSRALHLPHRYPTDSKHRQPADSGHTIIAVLFERAVQIRLFRDITLHFPFALYIYKTTRQKLHGTWRIVLQQFIDHTCHLCSLRTAGTLHSRGQIDGILIVIGGLKYGFRSPDACGMVQMAWLIVYEVWW